MASDEHSFPNSFLDSATDEQSIFEEIQESSSLDESDSGEPVAISILDRLKAPTQSDLHRKRKTKSNPPRGKKKRVDYTLPVPNKIAIFSVLRHRMLLNVTRHVIQRQNGGQTRNGK